MKENFKDCFTFEPKFYLLSKSDNRVVAVEKETEHGYEGVIIDFRYQHDQKPHYGFEANPYYIAKSFISQLLLKYDFTLEQKYAELHLVE